MQEDGRLFVGIAEELLREGFCATNTHGDSMLPLFASNRDAVVIKRAEGELEKYDIVLYRSLVRENVYVLHRIVGKTDEDYIIRGDNTYIDEHIPKGDILGVLVSFCRKGKNHTVDELGYRLYSRLRVSTYPIRRFFRRLKAFVTGKIAKIFKRKGE